MTVATICRDGEYAEGESLSDLLPAVILFVGDTELIKILLDIAVSVNHQKIIGFAYFAHTRGFSAPTRQAPRKRPVRCPFSISRLEQRKST